MPPKNKKQAEEEARRLQQERKKKQQQQALLQLERKKYAGQKLQTGLFLPASNQLIVDFFDKKLDFIGEKLTFAVKQSYQNLSDEDFLKNFLLKELHYCIKDARKIFKLEKIKNVEGNEKNLLKARVFVGIMLQVILNESPYIGGSGKVKSADEKLFKELVAAHSINKKPEKQKIFDQKSEIHTILINVARTYFSHFQLIKNYKNFDKRTDKKEYHIHMTVPGMYLNSKQTPWTDLAKKQQPEQKQQENKLEQNA